MRDKLKNMKGITLIALVITIVVILILATIAINLTLGDNGIFKRAKTAKEQYQNAQDDEEDKIAKYSNEIDSYVDGNRGNVTLTDEEYAQFKSLIQDKNKNYNYSTEEYVVGKWIDGKPVYQKTISIPAFTCNGNSSYQYTLISNVNLISATGSINNGPIIPTTSSPYYDSFVGIDGNNYIYVYRRNNSSSQTFTGGYITIQYTKTPPSSTTE